MFDESSAPEPPPRPRLARRLRLPEVSGKWTVFWLLVCLTITALLIPLVLKKPLWIELEFVVLAWWILWGLVLTKLLYKGEQVADDHQQHQARDWFGLNKNGSDLGGCGSGIDGEGCAILVGLIVALFLVWILIEFALPVLFFILYFLIRGMLVHVVHDKPKCQGDFGMAAFRGFLWATIYTAPLAGCIWLVHLAHIKRG